MNDLMMWLWMALFGVEPETEPVEWPPIQYVQERHDD